MSSSFDKNVRRRIPHNQFDDEDEQLSDDDGPQRSNNSDEDIDSNDGGDDNKNDDASREMINLNRQREFGSDEGKIFKVIKQMERE